MRRAPVIRTPETGLYPEIDALDATFEAQEEARRQEIEALERAAREAEEAEERRQAEEERRAMEANARAAGVHSGPSYYSPEEKHFHSSDMPPSKELYIPEQRSKFIEQDVNRIKMPIDYSELDIIRGGMKRIKSGEYPGSFHEQKQIQRYERDDKMSEPTYQQNDRDSLRYESKLNDPYGKRF
jgi:hypothetical protein